MSLAAALLGLEQLELEDERYAYASGSVRAHEPKLLDETALARLVDAEDLEEVWRFLIDAGFERLSDYPPERYEEALDQELRDLYAYLRSIEPDEVPSVADWLASRYDFHNLAVALKGYALGMESLERESAWVKGIGTVPPKLLETAVHTEIWDALPDPLAKAGQEALEAYERTGHIVNIDCAVERALLTHLHATAFHPFLEALAALWADLARLKIGLRAKALEIHRAGWEPLLGELPAGEISPYDLNGLWEQPLENWPETLPGEYGALIAQSLTEGRWNPARFEVLCDDFVMEHLRAVRYVPYGPSVLATYALAREAEIKNLHIVLVGKRRGLPPEAIRPQLRRSYA